MEELFQLGELRVVEVGLGGKIGDERGDGTAKGGVDELPDEMFEKLGLGDVGRVVVDAFDGFACEIPFHDEAGHHVENGRADDAACLPRQELRHRGTVAGW